MKENLNNHLLTSQGGRLPSKVKDDSCYGMINRVYAERQRLRIRDMDMNTAMEQVGRHLEQFMTDNGIKNKPTKEAAVKIFKVIIANYDDLEPFEIELASDLLLLGKIQVEDKHYGEINLSYITKMLNAYKHYKSHTLDRQFKKSEPEKTERSLPEKKKIFAEICHNIEKVYQRYLDKDKNLPGYYYNSVAFKLMEDIGLIVISNEDKKQILKEAENEMLNEKRESNKLKGRFDIMEQLRVIEDSTGLKWKAREIALFQYFERLIADGVKEITPLIKEKESVYLSKR